VFIADPWSRGRAAQAGKRRKGGYRRRSAAGWFE